MLVREYDQSSTSTIGPFWFYGGPKTTPSQKWGGFGVNTEPQCDGQKKSYQTLIRPKLDVTVQFLYTYRIQTETHVNIFSCLRIQIWHIHE